jgi:hypothetical protein
MTIPPDYHKSFVENNQTRIVCPFCATSKLLSVEKFRHKQHKLRVKCKCGHVFNIQLEFRRHHRKSTELEGAYGVTETSMGSGKIKVINLSLSGASFEMPGRHALQVGQKGILVFTLDDRKKTALKKKVVVRSIKGNIIGCEFIEDRAFQKELGFYLLP